MSWETSLLYFFCWNCTWFGQKDPIKVPIRLSTAQVKFHQIWTLIGSFCWKYIKFLLKKYRRVISQDTEEWCKIWEKNNLFFQKWQKFDKFWPEHWKISKICTLIGSFCAKYTMFDLKNTEELSFMTLKSDAKFEENQTCGLEHDMSSLVNFHQSTWKSQKWDFDGIV